MEELNLHSQGANQHLKLIKKRFEALKEQLQSNTSLSKTEKSIQIASVKDQYLKEKKELNSKLF